MLIYEINKVVVVELEANLPSNNEVTWMILIEATLRDLHNKITESI